MQVPARSLHAAVIVTVLLGMTRSAAPQSATDDGLAFFETHIRPRLIEHCDRCHSAGDQPPKGGLFVDTKAGLLSGGDSGPAIVPGHPEQSLLISALRHEDLKMPPQGKLPARVVADFEEWIRLGAPDPRVDALPTGKPSVDVAAARDLWCFQPVTRPEPPQPRDDAWPRGDIDRFILGELERAGIRPVADADRATWLRRVTFDLTGLPPSAEELAAFQADRSPLCREAVVDRLLASSHFGERWGRHWLDIARFAESTGGGRSMVFNEAWRYRDYVVSAFNDDKPFSSFIVEQLAGDLLPHDSPRQEADHLVATGYLMLGPTNYEEQDKRALEMDVADEQIDTIGRGLLAMTIGCARCHDHKFDPITTGDYYALAGIFRSTDMLVHENVSRWTERPLPMTPDIASAVATHEMAVATAREELAAAKAVLEKVGSGGEAPDGPIPVDMLPGIVIDDPQAQRVGEWTPSRHVKPHVGAGYVTDGDTGKGTKTLTFQPEFPGPGTYDVRLGYTASGNRASQVPVSLLTLDGEVDITVDMRQPPPVDGHFVSLGRHRFDDTNQWFLRVSNEGTKGYVVVDCVQFLPANGGAEAGDGPLPQDAEADPLTRARAAVKECERRLEGLVRAAPATAKAMAVGDAKAIADCPICIRGNVHHRGPVVPRGVIPVATLGAAPRMPSTASGRLELATWVANPEHPLTSRVWVNRVWHHLFGAGLVRTVDNFGTTGERPSHPRLLDHLARRFTDGGWSTKSLVRAIVLSRTYGLASTEDPRAAAVDPENRLCWRMRPRRLDAESLRDAMLLASGELDRSLGGPGILDPAVANKGSDAPTEYSFIFTDLRRSIYVPAFRNRRMELFQLFDGADPNAVTGARSTSTVAPQALFMLNSPFLMERARAAAARILNDPQASDDDLVTRAFIVTVGRPPRPPERTRVLAEVRPAGEAVDPAESRMTSWARVFQAIFCSIDFRYLD